MWFDLDLFGTRKKRLRELDAAAEHAGRLSNSLNAAVAAAGDTLPLSGSRAFMAAVQIRSLLETGGDDLRTALRREGSPFHAAFDIAPQWTDSKVLADALKGLRDLLEGQRNALLAQEREDQGPQGAAVLPPAAGRPPGADPAGPAGPVHPSEAALLWGVTDKLYASWHLRGILLLVAIAIAIALGGSFVIGNQTLNVRKSLDDAQEKAQTELRNISATAQTRVSDESKEIVTRLHERGTDIDAQLKKAETEVADLKAGSDTIKKDIVAKLQDDLRTQETSLKDEIVKPLIKARDEDLKTISDTLEGIRKSLAQIGAGADEQKAKLNTIGPKLAELGIYAKQSDDIGAALARIKTDQEAANTGRLKAETEANTAMLQRKAAEASAAEAEKQRGQTSGAVKTANDEALKHIATLGGIGEQLKGFDGRLKQADEKLNTVVAEQQREFENKRQQLDDKLNAVVAEQQKALENKRQQLDEKLNAIVAEQQKALESKRQQLDEKLNAVVAEQQKAFESKREQLEAKLNDDISAEETRLKAVKGLIDRLEKDARNPPKPPETTPVPPKPKTLADLTLDERQQIQRRLVNGGREIGKIDGKFGPKTVQAIRNFQKKIGSAVTGQLTTDQIADLLKPK